jgi:proline dehydrogenase
MSTRQLLPHGNCRVGPACGRASYRPGRAGTRACFATHDLRLIQKIEQVVQELGLPKESVEFQLLYGIQRAEQVRLAQAGYRVCVLISYGSQWFPWYMRRLAERPANLTFVIRNMFSG